MINARIAYLLFALLIIVSIVALKGKALAFAIIIVLALALKTFVEQLRREP